MADEVRRWLAEVDCERYFPAFVQNGFSTLASLSGVNDAVLNRMAVINPTHRQAILHKCHAETGIDLDFDSLLGDLSSAIQDLESIAAPSTAPGSLTTNPLLMETQRHNPVVVTSGSSSGNSTPSGSLNRPGAKVEHKIIAPVIPSQQPDKDQDFDLDALLGDLESFDPLANSATPTSPVTLSRPPTTSAPSQLQKDHSAGGQVLPQPYTVPQPQPYSQPQSQHIKSGSVSTPEQSPSHQRSLDTTDGPSSRQQTLPADGKLPDGPKEVMVLSEPKLTGASEEITRDLEQQRLEQRAAELRENPTLSENEKKAKMEEEKMRIALEKMKIASKKKAVIKVFNNDGSNKAMVVEEGMTAAQACYLLVMKNHFEESPNWSLIERLEDVWLERELEDHECVEEVYSHWARNSNNQFLFRRNDTKYELFMDPIKYFPTLLTNTLIGKDKMERAEKARKILVQEYFSSALRVPEGIEGYLHLKDGYKGKWRKLYVILRASGLYQTLKGKQKTARNLQLLVQFEECDLYRGVSFKKFLKAQTDYCFALRPRPDQVVPGSKDIKVFCSESQDEFLSWYAGIRLAMNGQKLYDNYYNAHVKQFKLEDAESNMSQVEEKTTLLTGRRLEKQLDKKREHYLRDKEAREAQENMMRHPVFPSEEDHRESAAPLNIHDREPSPQAVPEPLHRAPLEPPTQAPLEPSPRAPLQPPLRTPLEPSPRAPPEPSPRIPLQPPLRTPSEQLPGASLESTPPGPSESSPRGTLESAQKVPPKTPPKVQPKPSNVNRPVPAPRPVRAPKPHKPRPDDITVPPTSSHQPPPPPQRQHYPPPRHVPPPSQAHPAPYTPPLHLQQQHYPPPSQPAPPMPIERVLPVEPPALPTSPIDTMSQFAWYHGAIPREEAVRRLEQAGAREGCFLVRDSSSVPNSFVLTMFAKSVPKNFQIMPYEAPGGRVVYRIDDGPAFHAIEDLLYHYKLEPDRLPCRLTEFCPRPPTRMTEC